MKLHTRTQGVVMSNPGEKTENTTMEDKSNILCINHEASKESFQEPMNDNKQDNKEEVVNGLSSGHQSDKGYMETENTKIDINGKEVCFHTELF